MATFNGVDIWGIVSSAGGLLTGKLGELTRNSLSRTLLRLAVASRERGGRTGSKLMSRQGRSIIRNNNSQVWVHNK